MNRTKTVLLGVSTFAAGAVIAGGVTLATAASGDDDKGETPGHGHGFGWGHGRGHDHSPVTGSEKTKVSDAVTKKYADVTVETVLKDEDGSYDVLGKQGGKPVLVQASKDLRTIELHSPGFGRFDERGGPGKSMGRHEPVTGAERTKVVDAVTAKHKDVKVMVVLEDDEGAYDVLGIQGDHPVRVQVSKDLATITLEKGGPGMGMWHGRGHGGPHRWGPPPGFGPRGDDEPSSGPRATPSSTT